MKEQVVSVLSKLIKLDKKEIEKLVEIPKDSSLGDFAFPCFSLSREMKKNPVEIAKDLSGKLKSKEFEKVEAKGPYLNFFVNKSDLISETLKAILKEKDKYGSSSMGKGKTIVIDMSSPNMAKPFGIGHLRSTIIGNSISQISKFSGFKVIKINYLGDWGTPYGKIISGFQDFGNKSELKKNPIKHLYEIYVKVSKDEKYEEKGRETFRKLESGDPKIIKIWEEFRKLSLNEFKKIYSLLNIDFDVVSGESLYNNKMDAVVKELEKKNLLEESEGAMIVNLEKYGLEPCLIKKSDGTTLYATRDITAAIDRHNKYHFDRLFYEVGQEQKLHFKQFFKVLELMGYPWAKNCVHIEHGLYLGEDGKKFATRHGKTIFMEDVLNETIELAKKEIEKREKVKGNELAKRAKAIALSAILYGDLKNYRANDAVFDIEKFLSFEGNTGPYLLYSYARAKSIVRKSKVKPKVESINLSEKETRLITKLSQFPEVVNHSYAQLSPNLIANYSFELSQLFNEFYHSTQVIGAENEASRLAIVSAFAQVLKNALSLLGISTIEKM